MENDNTNKVLKELQDLYLKGDIENFKSKLINNKSQMSDGLFHYNLGTAFAKQGNYAAARYNLEKSMTSGFIHPSLRKNLNSIKEKLNTAKDDTSHTSSVFTGIVTTSSPIFLSISLSLILIVSLLWKIKFIEKLRYLLLLSFISMTPIAIKTYYSKEYKVGINIKKIKVFEGPSEIYESINEVEAGQKLIIGKSYEEWSLIEWPPENIGWIKRDDLGLL